MQKMIDCITCRLYNNGIAGWTDCIPFERNGITYYPTYRNGEVFCFRADIRNMQVLLYPSVILLKNSIHKFYHGNNYGEFNRTEFIQSIDKLIDVTGFNWWEADVTRLEYGINLNFTPPNDIINSLILYKTKEFIPMITKTKRIGKKCEMTAYKLKCYNKTQYYKLVEKQSVPDNIIRFEIAVNNMAYLLKRTVPITIRNLRDLSKPEIMKSLLEDLLTKFKECVYSRNYNIESLTANEKKVYAIMVNPDLRRILKLHNPHTYRRDSKIFRDIISKGKKLNNTFLNELEQQKVKLLE